MVTAPAESDLRRGNYSLADIISIDDLQNLQDSFAKANRVASTIINLDGSPITKFSNYSAVCALVRQTEKGNANCARSGRILGELSLQGKQPACHFCHSIGFMDAAAPIVIDGVHLANWLIGQNCIGTVDVERVAAYAEEIGADKRQLLAAFDSMEKISEKEFRDKLDFLWLMANQISNQAYQHLRYQTMLVSLEQSKEELTAYKDKLEELVNQRTAELEKAIEKIQQISITDALTGCFNRGGIISNLHREIKRARRYNNPLSILLFDLDHFKKINDTYGHQSGDTVLQQVVATIQPLVRDGVDWLARYGGEEFLVVMPLKSCSGAVTALSKNLSASPNCHRRYAVFWMGLTALGNREKRGQCPFFANAFPQSQRRSVLGQAISSSFSGRPRNKAVGRRDTPRRPGQPPR